MEKLIILLFIFLLGGCSDRVEIVRDKPTKYPNVPTYSIVIELEKEEAKWNQKK